MILVDSHCHILPAVDDGAKDLRTALHLAKAAVEQGISHILLTPHHMDGQYINHKADILKLATNFQRELVNSEIPLTVFPSQEVHLSGNLLQAIVDEDVLFMDEKNRYLLLELPHNELSGDILSVIFKLIDRGITPVITHPEWNQEIQRDPDKLYELVRLGCLTQLTSGSYLGAFGKRIQTLTEQIIAANLGFCFASDAHGFRNPQFLLKEAFQKLAFDEGREKANLFSENTRNIINGNEVTKLEAVRISSLSKKRLWIF